MTTLELGSVADQEERIASALSTFRRSYGDGEAQNQLIRTAKEVFADAIAVRDRGDTTGAIACLVRSVELNPRSDETRLELARLISQVPGRDLTQTCLIFPDSQRATKFYGDAIQTALDFVTYGGVIGDVLEFGVLGGWTARLFAERMRDMQFYGDIHLFDSFKGLPREKGSIDKASYDVTRGIWDGEMELPETYLSDLNARLPLHIKSMLSRVISDARISIHEGFYSDTLKVPLNLKAAVVHLDCDLYQSTREVLEALSRDDVLQDGTVLLFDDWNCNKANPAFGQRRAFSEFLEMNRDRYSASKYFNYGFNCSAFILHDLHGIPDQMRAEASRFFQPTQSVRQDDGAGPISWLEKHEF